MTRENLSLLAAKTRETVRISDEAVVRDAEDEFLRHLNKETGRDVYGRDAVYNNLMNGAIRTLTPRLTIAHEIECRNNMSGMRAYRRPNIPA